MQPWCISIDGHQKIFGKWNGRISVLILMLQEQQESGVSVSCAGVTNLHPLRFHLNSTRRALTLLLAAGCFSSDLSFHGTSLGDLKNLNDWCFVMGGSISPSSPPSPFLSCPKPLLGVVLPGLAKDLVQWGMFRGKKHLMVGSWIGLVLLFCSKINTISCLLSV